MSQPAGTSVTGHASCHAATTAQEGAEDASGLAAVVFGDAECGGHVEVAGQRGADGGHRHASSCRGSVRAPGRHLQALQQCRRLAAGGQIIFT
jgi:hypothetical protein